MSELLLQTVIEKLEALEIALLKMDASDTKTAMIVGIAEDLKQMRSETEVFLRDVRLINENMVELGKSLSACCLRSQQVLSTSIEHRHHLHKGI